MKLYRKKGTYKLQYNAKIIERSKRARLLHKNCVYNNTIKLKTNWKKTTTTIIAYVEHCMQIRRPGWNQHTDVSKAHLNNNNKHQKQPTLFKSAEIRKNPKKTTKPQAKLCTKIYSETFTFSRVNFERTFPQNFEPNRNRAQLTHWDTRAPPIKRQSVFAPRRLIIN